MTAAWKPTPLRFGDRVWFDDAEWAAVRYDGGFWRLRQDDGTTTSVDLQTLVSDPTFHVVGHDPFAASVALTLNLLDEFTVDEIAEAERMARHLKEVFTGYPDGYANDEHPKPRPQYDTSRPQKERIATKVDELKALGLKGSPATLYRKWEHLNEGGLRRLIVGNAGSSFDPLAKYRKAWPGLIECIQDQFAAEVGKSTGDRKRFHWHVKERLAAKSREDGADYRMPSQSTFNRILRYFPESRQAFRSAKALEQMALNPPGIHTPKRALAPGDIMEIDATRLNIRVRDHLGNVTHAELIVLIDVCTKLICGWDIVPITSKAVDAAWLLAQALRPPTYRQGWPEAVRFAASQVPFERAVTIDQRLAHASLQPAIFPKEIQPDNGRTFRSNTFDTMTAFLGSTVQMSRVHTPTDKPHVERGFRSAESFLQFFRGYTGGSVERRGSDADDDAVFGIHVVKDLFAEYLYVVYNRTPQKGLREPGNERRRLTPIEMYELHVHRTGFVHVPAPEDIYFQCLPTKRRKITERGVEIDRLHYSGEAIAAFRRPSGAPDGKWTVKVDPHDRSRVWWQHPEDGDWHPLHWVHAPYVGEPLSDHLIRHCAKTADDRVNGRRATEAEIAQVLDDLRRRAATGDLTKAEKKVVALDTARTPIAAERRHESGGPAAADRPALTLLDGMADEDDEWSDPTDTDDETPDTYELPDDDWLNEGKQL